MAANDFTRILKPVMMLMAMTTILCLAMTLSTRIVMEPVVLEKWRQKEITQFVLSVLRLMPGLVVQYNKIIFIQFSSFTFSAFHFNCKSQGNDSFSDCDQVFHGALHNGLLSYQDILHTVITKCHLR